MNKHKSFGRKPREALLGSILRLPRIQKRVIAAGSDATLLFFAFWASFALRLDQPMWLPNYNQLAVAITTIFLTVSIFTHLGLYRIVVRFFGDRAFVTILYGMAASCLLLVLFSYWLQAFLPRSVPIIYGVIGFILISGIRLAARMLVNRSLQLTKERVAIVGAGNTGLQLASALEQGTEFRPVVFFTFDRANHKSSISGLPVVSIDLVEKTVRKQSVARILLALDTDSTVDRKRLIKQLETIGIPVQTVPSMSEVVAGRARINEIRDLDLEDLLGRDPVGPDSAVVSQGLFQKNILVTGAGGSIGSELCRQIIAHRPNVLVLLEQNEYALYSIERELNALKASEGIDVEIHPVLGNIVQKARCESIMQRFDVQTVYHAAAYKHVPLVEQNVVEGVLNNTFGTLHMAEASISAGVERFVLISTDKAVRPTNVMGASKRMAELVLQGLAMY